MQKHTFCSVQVALGAYAQQAGWSKWERECRKVPLWLQGLETTVGKERWVIMSGTAVVATRTQVAPLDVPSTATHFDWPALRSFAALPNA